jgi:uncharacterized protein DUF6265
LPSERRSVLGRPLRRGLALVLLVGACRPSADAKQPSTAAEAAPPSAIVDRDDEDPIGLLEFMLGEWVTETPAGRVIERWSRDGDAMIGHSETVRDGTVSFFEELRIEIDGGTTVYLARPMGREPAVPFRRVDDGRIAELAVFENPAHDFPRRITYRRDGDQLVAAVEGDGEPIEWRYSRVQS